QALQHGRIRFLATSGEEMEQLGSQTLYEQGYMDDVDALLIAEPCQDIMVYAHKGSMDYRITSYGKSAHSSMPVMGTNAIKPLISFIQDIDDAYARISKEVQGKALDFIESIERITRSLTTTAALEVVECVIQCLVISNTSINGGVLVNSVPEEADADFNIRTIPEYDNEQVKTFFSNTIQNHNDKGANL